MWVFLCASDSAGLLRALSSARMYECVYLCMYQFEFVVCRSISVASQQTPANNRTTTTSTHLRLDHDDITWLDIYGGGIVRRIKRYTWASEQLHWIIYWTVITGCAVAQQFYYIDIHTHLVKGPFSGTTRVSQYQEGKTNLDFTVARDSEWQWHQLGHMQVYTSLQTDNHASTPPLSFVQAGCPSCRPINSVKALEANK